MAASFIAKRYLSANRGNRFMSWITFLSISGMAIGVAAMIVVLSVINGFETELRNRFLAANAHILAFQYPSGLDNVDQWLTTIQSDFGPELSGMSPFVHMDTMVTKGTLMHNVLVRGINPKLRKEVQDYTNYIKPLEAMDELQKRITMSAEQLNAEIPPIILGVGLASLLDVKIGDEVQLIFPESNSIGELKPYKFVGVYDSGLKHYDNKLGILSLPDSQILFGMKNRVHGIEIGLKNPDQSMEVAAKMSEKYTFTVKEWQSFNKPMFEAMKMERPVIGLIVFLVAAVAGFNILTTLFITVHQKQKSISILKSLGASNGYILRIFVIQGLIIGIIGSLIGIVLAVLISQALQRYEFVNLPDLYLLAKLPIKYDWKVYVSMAGAGVTICLLAGIYPAWVAAKMNIVDGFKGRQRAG